jgi:hypothetical protein
VRSFGGLKNLGLVGKRKGDPGLGLLMGELGRWSRGIGTSELEVDWNVLRGLGSTTIDQIEAEEPDDGDRYNTRHESGNERSNPFGPSEVVPGFSAVVVQVDLLENILGFE